MNNRFALVSLAIVAPLIVFALSWSANGLVGGAGTAVIVLVGAGLAWRWTRTRPVQAVVAQAAKPQPVSVVQEAGRARESSIALSAAVVDLLASAEATTVRAVSVSAAADQVSQDTQTIAAGSEEMSATVREIASTTGEAARVAGEALGLVGDAETAVRRLGDSSQGIGDVVKTISGIAAQTNLLALNATIEAARAGEAGRGFAVVAGEVKGLARQTAEATADVGKRIAAIQADTVAAMAAISEISSRIGRIHEVQQTIASAVEEQSATTQEMARTISSTAQGAAVIAKDITGVSEDAKLAAMATVMVRDLAVSAVRSSESVLRDVDLDSAAHRDHGVPGAFFDRVIRAHISWRSRLLAAIDGLHPPDRSSAVDADACELGKCLIAERGRLSGHPDFQRLVDQHRLFHVEVGKVIDLVVAKRLDEARVQVLSGAFAVASQATIALIARLKPLDAAETHHQSLAWSPAYATGVAQIDTQHQELFAKVSTLHAAMMSGAGQSKVIELVGFLADYTVNHFRDEERLMERARYAEIESHRGLHRTLLEQVGTLQAKLKAGEQPKTMEVTDFLAGWLRHHILKIDHAYIPSLRAAGFAGL
jgi:hemerythrin-like metal-binding protein